MVSGALLMPSSSRHVSTNDAREVAKYVSYTSGICAIASFAYAFFLNMSNNSRAPMWWTIGVACSFWPLVYFVCKCVSSCTREEQGYRPVK